MIFVIRLRFKKRLNSLRSKHTCSNVVGVYAYFNLPIKSCSVCFHVQIHWMRMWKSKMISILKILTEDKSEDEGEDKLNVGDSWGRLQKQWLQCLRYDISEHSILNIHSTLVWCKSDLGKRLRVCGTTCEEGFPVSE